MDDRDIIFLGTRALMTRVGKSFGRGIAITLADLGAEERNR